MTQTLPTTNGNGTVPILAELGDTGLKRSWGLITEEFLPALQWDKANQVYREMGDNDPTVGAVLYALTNMVRQVTWAVTGDEQTFVEDNLAAMSQTIESFVDEALSKLQYGWSYHEVVYQQVGGRIFWRKFPIRAQDTLRRWEFDDNGGIQGMTQSSPGKNFAEVFIPIEKAMLFRTSTAKNNPQGRSVLRSAYRPWWFAKRIQELEAIGVERDLAGIPIARIPATLIVAGGAEYTAYKAVVTNLRQDEQAGMVLPSDRDDNGNLLYDIELLSTSGSKQMDTGAILGRYAAQIAMCAMADVILLGHENVGSYALSSTKEQLLVTALQAQVDEIAAVLNRHALPRLFALNGMDQGDTKIVPGSLRSENLKDVAEMVKNFNLAGWAMFPDTALEEHLRGLLDFPEPDLTATAPSPAAQEAQMEGEDVIAEKMAGGFTRLADALLATREIPHVTVTTPPVNVTTPPVNVVVEARRGGTKLIRDEQTGVLLGIEETDAATD